MRYCFLFVSGLMLLSAGALTSDDFALGKAREILARMTLEEKASLCGGNGTMTLNAIPRVGISDEWNFSDSSHTVRTNLDRDTFAHDGEEVPATVLPTLSALAATWNVNLAASFGHVIGEEARSRGKDQMLGPGVNIMRTPLCGRNWEYVSEDPILVSRLIVPEIKALQSHDVAACVKHFALNGQELSRYSVDTIVDERTLNEIYLPAFRAAVGEAGVLTLMTAYNKYNGLFMSENAYMLKGVLRDQWHFLGSIVTDWGGQRSCDFAANNGCGIEMNAGAEIRHLRNNKTGALPLADAVRKGLVPESTLDDMALRTLYVMAKVNFFDREKRKDGVRNTPGHQEVARKVGEEAVVLLKNELKLLPLDPSKVRKILLVGNLADVEHTRSGWSAEGCPPYEITPAEGLKEFFKNRGCDVELERAPLGIGDYSSRMHAIDDRYVDTYDTTIKDAGMSVRAWNVDTIPCVEDVGGGIPVGNPVARSFSRQVNCKGEDALSFGVKKAEDVIKHCIRYSTRIVAPETGKYVFSLCVAPTDNDYAALSVGGEQKLDWRAGSLRANGICEACLEKDKSYEVVVFHRGCLVDGVESYCKLSWMLPSEKGVSVEELKRKSANADVVLVFTGTTVGHGQAKECEGDDRPNMKMAEGIDEAVAEILSWKLGNVVVVNHSGSPMEMPWVDRCPTLVQQPYLGQEAGRPLARIVFGEVNPSGKLPCTWPRRYEDTGVARAGTYNGTSVVYNERFYIGYRWFDKQKIKPMFPFGHGLSYTDFAFANVNASVGAEALVISAEVTNTGLRKGKETVQVYVSCLDSRVERCVKELKGFEKVELDSGEAKTVRIGVPLRDLAYYDTFLRRFVLERGRYEFLVGSSAADIRCSCMAEVNQERFFDN